MSVRLESIRHYTICAVSDTSFSEHVLMVIMLDKSLQGFFLMNRIMNHPHSQLLLCHRCLHSPEMLLVNSTRRCFP